MSDDTEPSAVWTVEAVLWDLDGTLVESIEATEIAWRAWADQLGLTSFDHADFHGIPAAAIVRGQVPAAQVAEALALITDLEERQTDGIVARPGAAALLEALCAHRWAIVTSGTEALASTRLNLAGLPRPEVMVTADSVERGKPAPEGFQLGARLLGVDPSRTVAIEDSPAGIEAARAAGCRTIGVCGTFPAAELLADVVVADLADLRIEEVDDERIRITAHG